MLADIQVRVHTIASQDMWGLHEQNNDRIKLMQCILPDQNQNCP